MIPIFFSFAPLTKVQWDSPTRSSSILTTLSSSSSHRHCLPHHRPCNAHGHAMLWSIELGVIGERLVPLSLNLSLVHHLPRHSCNQPQSWHRMGTVSKNAIKAPNCLHQNALCHLAMLCDIIMITDRWSLFYCMVYFGSNALCVYPH